MFSFPRTVNEKAARVVAAGVMVASILALATGWHWILAVLAYGFGARVLAGPTFSPLAQLATRAIAPRLGAPKTVPGPPKRFAQAIGFALTTAGAILALGFGETAAADALLAMMVGAAGLEALFAFCVGCRIFGLLMRAGVIPDQVCADCADVWSRPAVGRSGA